MEVCIEGWWSHKVQDSNIYVCFLFTQKECTKPDIKELVYLSKLSGHTSVWSFYRGVGNIWIEMSNQPVHMTRRCNLSSESLALQLRLLK